MRSLLMATFILVFFCCMNQQEAKKMILIKGIRIERNFPVLGQDSIKKNLIVQRYDPYYTEIYYYNDQKIIRSNYYSRNIHLKKPADTSYFTSQKFISVYYTFIFSEKSNKGLLIDSTKPQIMKIVDKDSMLSNEWALKTDKSTLLKDNEYKILSSEVNADGDIIEKYFLKNIKEPTMTGTLFLTFSKTKMKNFDYSLAKDLEKKRKMKLIKLTSINDAHKLDTSNASYYMERVEIPYEIKEIKIENKDELLKMFIFAKATLK